MSETATWALYGAGNIGGELQKQVSQPEVAARLGLEPKPLFVLNSTGVWESDLERPSQAFHDLGRVDPTEFPDVSFIALPSTHDGVVATEHIARILQIRDDTVAVTAEKGAIANNFGELRQASDDFQRLGIDATVGGGTRIVDAIRLYTREDPANVSQIHAALNGTLSFIMSEIGPLGSGAGVSRGEAVNQAVRLGYAEPGSKSFDEVVRAEAEGDVPKKTAILVNRLDLAGGELLDWQDLRFELTPQELRRVVREARTRRFIVSIISKHYFDAIDPAEEDIIGGFNADHGNFQIVGGFQNVNHEPLGALGEITGPGNGALVGLGPNEGDGMYRTGFGPGAGGAATVNTMLDNYSRLRRELARPA